MDVKIYKSLMLEVVVAVSLIAIPIVNGVAQEAKPSTSNAVAKKPNQDDSSARLRLTIKMEDKSFGTFFNRGFLVADVPKASQGKLAAIRIRTVDNFIDRPEMLKTDSEIIKGVLNISLTPEMMEEVHLHPIEVTVPKGNYEKVRLLVRSDGTDPLLKDAKKETGKSGPNKKIALATSDLPFLFIRVGFDKGVFAQIESPTAIELETQFGTVNVGAEKIAGLRLVNEGQKSIAYVVLENGDRMKAAVPAQELVLKTQWGTQILKTTDVFSFTRSEQSKFQTVVAEDGKKSYRLVESLQPADAPKK